MHLQGKKRTIPVAAAVLVSALLASCGGGGSASSSSAADCVLNNVGSAQTDAAVLAIQRACHSKFPPSRTEIDASRAERAAREQAQREAMAAANAAAAAAAAAADRSEEHTSELQSLMRISYAVFCLKKKK